MVNKEVYLDNGATTKVDPEVIKVMNVYHTEKYGNASSLHSKGNEAKAALEAARKVIAESINATADELIFTSGGTESDNLAIKGVAYARGKGHIITSKIEHPAVLNTCKQLEKEGFSVTYLNVDKEGFIELDKLENAFKADTILVSIMHANNEIGTIQPLDEIGQICKNHNVIFHTDAVQSFTKVPIDVRKTNVDLISFSGHKIHGPKGIGALFIRKEHKRLLKKLSEGGSHEYNIRAGTENVPGICGFAKAVEIAMQDKQANSKMAVLRDKLIDSILKEIPDVILNGPKEDRLCNNVNVSIKYIEGESLIMLLDSDGVCASTGSACSQKSLAPSHVLTAIGLRPEIAHGSLRLTLSRYTTEDDIRYAVASIKEVTANLRKLSPWSKKTDSVLHEVFSNEHDHHEHEE